MAAAGEGALVVEAPAVAVAAGLAAGVGAVGGSEAGADEHVPVVAHLVGEGGLHTADDEGVDLGVDVNAPADGAVDGGGGLDVLDLLTGGDVLAAELEGEDKAVEALVGHLLRGPLGEVAQLLRLVTGLQEHLLHASDAFEHGRLLDGVLALDDLGTDHVQASPGASAGILEGWRAVARRPPRYRPELRSTSATRRRSNSPFV